MLKLKLIYVIPTDSTSAATNGKVAKSKKLQHKIFTLQRARKIVSAHIRKLNILSAKTNNATLTCLCTSMYNLSLCDCIIITDPTVYDIRSPPLVHVHSMYPCVSVCLRVSKCDG